MNLSEIIAEIDEKYPNSLANDSKVRKINELQKRFFRTVVRNTVATSYDILNGQAQYPITLQPSKIREVLVDGVKYEYKQLEAMAISRFYYNVKGFIGLYPTPDKDIKDGLLLFHYEEPTELTVDNLSATPDLDSDFHFLLVYGVCKEIAENSNEYDVSGAFVTAFKDLLNDYYEANQDSEPAQIQEEVWWTS